MCKKDENNIYFGFKLRATLIDTKLECEDIVIFKANL